MKVTLYTSPTCGYCHQVKAYLAQKGVKYIERDISVDRSAADEMMKLTGQMGVPVIVVNGQPMVGFNRPMLDKLLAIGGGSNKPRFGLKIADAGKIAQKVGAYVGQVAPGSLGQKAGLTQGDIITEVNTRSINNAADLESALGSITSGRKVSIVFIRGSGSLRREIAV
ncbi:glutaredoxin domain-containing protein [Chloroflexota bacterium]